MPAYAGIQGDACRLSWLGPRFRGDDGCTQTMGSPSPDGEPSYQSEYFVPSSAVASEPLLTS